MFANGYLLNAWLSFITDCEKVPYIMISVNATQRQMSIPMEFVQGEFLTLNASPASTGYFSVDHTTGYLAMSARFNGINRDMMIPLETIVVVRSKCGTIGFDMPPVLFGDESALDVAPNMPGDEPESPPPPKQAFKPTLVHSNSDQEVSRVPAPAKKPTLTVVK